MNPTARTILLVLATVASTQTGGEEIAATAKTRYSTKFNLTETPISENRVWSHAGVDWTRVKTSGGSAKGTLTGNQGYNDSYALLSGFPSEQSVSTVVLQSPTIDKSCTHEVEILLRFTDSEHSAKGYEVLLSFDGASVQIVRWNGPIGDFTVLASGAYPSFRNGDTFEASIAHNVITAYVNDTLVAQATDSTFSTGNPGMGFFRRACGTNDDLTFTSYLAVAHP